MSESTNTCQDLGAAASAFAGASLEKFSVEARTEMTKAGVSIVLHTHPAASAHLFVGTTEAHRATGHEFPLDLGAAVAEHLSQGISQLEPRFQEHLAANNPDVRIKVDIDDGSVLAYVVGEAGEITVLWHVVQTGAESLYN